MPFDNAAVEDEHDRLPRGAVDEAAISARRTDAERVAQRTRGGRPVVAERRAEDAREAGRVVRREVGLVDGKAGVRRGRADAWPVIVEVQVLADVGGGTSLIAV